jgi:hypothetical protein
MEQFVLLPGVGLFAVRPKPASASFQKSIVVPASAFAPRDGRVQATRIRKEVPVLDDKVRRNKENVRRFFEGAFNEGDLSLVDKLLAPGYTFNGHPSPPAQTKQWVAGLREMLSGLHFTIDDILGEDNKVALRWTLVGTDQQKNLKLTNSGTNIITVDDEGRAVSNWQSGGTPQDLQPVNPPAAGAPSAAAGSL